MEDLKELVSELSARLDALQARNAVLEETVSRLSGGTKDEPREIAPAAGDLSRRRLLGRAVGVAAVGAAALTLAEASPAAAATGDALLVGNSNTAGANTALTCTDNTTTALYVVDGLSSGIGYTAAVIGDSSNQNGVAGVTSAANAVGVYGVSRARSGLGYAPAAVFGDSNVHPGVYGQSGFECGVGGVSGATTNSSGAQAGVWGDSAGNLGVVGTSGTSYGVYGASTHSTGIIGLGGTVGVAAQGPTGIMANSNSATGQALIVFAGSTKSAAQVTNNGAGPGLQVIAGSGRGATLKGGAAQLQLVPGPRSTHPVSGLRGDLYADTAGRLWFCKVGGSHATWHQIA